MPASKTPLIFQHVRLVQYSLFGGRLTFLNDCEELISAGVLEAGTRLEVFGKANHSSDIQSNSQGDVVHVQLSARWHACRVSDDLIQD